MINLCRHQRVGYKKVIEKVKIKRVFKPSKSTEIDPFVDMGDTTEETDV